MRVRDDAARIEELDRAQAVAFRAGAQGIVERKQARFQLGQGITAGRAGELGREQVLLARVCFHRDGAAFGMAQRRLEGFGQALLQLRPDLEPVDHHVGAVLDVLGQLGQGVDVVDLAVHAQAHETLRAQLREQVRLLPLSAGDDRREDHQLGVLRQRKHVVDHLRHRLRFQRQRVLGAVGRADAGVQEAQVIVDLGHRADGGARVVAGGLLLDGDRGRQALDQVDIGLFHELQELARVGRQRLDVAPLALGIERVECKRGLA